MSRFLLLSLLLLLSYANLSVQASPMLLNSAYESKKNKALTIRSSQQAAQIAKSRYGGKVLQVKKSKVNGNPGYRVKLIKPDGNVVSIKIDAITGRVSG